jgi:hypothetical protein
MLELLDQSYGRGLVGYCELAPASVCAHYAYKNARASRSTEGGPEGTIGKELPCIMRNIHGVCKCRPVTVKPKHATRDCAAVASDQTTTF